ncbi:MAG: hypothetical protein UT24_C0006G0016 [Candidatus Woesebacteria bacterium GW2011_GWB1_39_12]|uniref:Uncharacterized protein n=2 Tax=Candidatus Woeseibacteriota TaxID=1752722 RepID=A0A0G0Q7J0_9BACT|nr:MAG: hypothetical protein UT23_C0010G0017 [Candidatus Woesebacteria bacterium GW2011_GWA1_39_12]KKR01168.1 MAG: hypothetical protein UT24_C0006G0016 [Candidatus Woesebacteria bacterium GW2011_GWB1_39_12]
MTERSELQEAQRLNEAIIITCAIDPTLNLGVSTGPDHQRFAKTEANQLHRECRGNFPEEECPPNCAMRQAAGR